MIGIARNRRDGWTTLHRWTGYSDQRTVCGLRIDRDARDFIRGRGDAPVWEVLGLDANEPHCLRCFKRGGHPSTGV